MNFTFGRKGIKDIENFFVLFKIFVIIGKELGARNFRRVDDLKEYGQRNPEIFMFDLINKSIAFPDSKTQFPRGKILFVSEGTDPL